MGFAGCSVYFSPELSGNGVLGFGLGDVSLIFFLFFSFEPGRFSGFGVLSYHI